MFETVGVMAVSACILQMVYEKIEKQQKLVKTDGGKLRKVY